TGVITAETVLIRVIVLRADGTEFPASVTTPTYTRLTAGVDPSRRSWTVAFRAASNSVESTDSPAAAPAVSTPAPAPAATTPRSDTALAVRPAAPPATPPAATPPARPPEHGTQFRTRAE